jgi:hypothetical protein
MHDFCFNPDHGINDVANQVGMRMDLHILGFDRGEYTIAVKAGRAVVHVLRADPVTRAELIPQFHNAVFDTDGLAIPFLYTRFAWSIFVAGHIRLRRTQRFLIARKGGVEQNVMDYMLRRTPASRGGKSLPTSQGMGKMPVLHEGGDEMKEQDDEGYDWENLSEDDQLEDGYDSHSFVDLSFTITISPLIAELCGSCRY